MEKVNKMFADRNEKIGAKEATEDRLMMRPLPSPLQHPPPPPSAILDSDNDVNAAGPATTPDYCEEVAHGGNSCRCSVGEIGDYEDNVKDKKGVCSYQRQQKRSKSKIHLGMIPSLLFLLFVFSSSFLSAQRCSAEVVRLRHPDHLYYGDRGSGPPFGNLHRHSNNIIMMNLNHDFLMEAGDATDVGSSGSSGAVSSSSQDEDGGELTISMEQQQQQQHPHRSGHSSAFSLHNMKRKSHSNNNNNKLNNNDNRNNSSDSISLLSGASSNKILTNEHLHQHEEETNQNNNDLPLLSPAAHSDAGESPALEDVQLPVYFARQGNDGNQEVDQSNPTIAGSSSSEEAAAANKGNEGKEGGTTDKPPEADGKLFPPDLFTLEERRKGAVVFYIIGVMYMFVALAIVCDEFFVPSLDVIIEFLQIQDDVAGATFMAAGGSAPELFTSVIGVFISKDDVGIGTIVGSAVFNILFVIGMCAIFSKTVLCLTWWPLFRDCSFYSVALITLIFFFRDSYIYWWEALILFSIYLFYVTFMKFNATFEKALKKLLFKNRVTRVSSTDQLVNNSVNNGASSSQTSVQTVSGNQSSRGSATLKPPLSAQGRRNSIPMLHSGSKFRHGLLQLMIQSIDPLHDGRVDEKATQLHAIASLKALLDAAKTEADSTVTNNSRSKPVSPPQVPANVQPSDAPLTAVEIEEQEANGNVPTIQELAALQEAEDEGHEPLDISWPKGDCKKQISYIVLFPIMFSLFLTLPDTRTPRGKKYFYWGFLGSILWIAIFSYFMVWWADKTGETFGIAPEIMGLTFLAAGTSIPDLITSVIVARKGLGDMAVSSSVGSNIFDVCVGLPIPWLLYGIINGEPVEVSAKGMLCSISILFGMLCFVVLSIMAFRWRMNKGLGLVMFILYFIFLGVSLLFEYNVLTCPTFLEA